MTKRKNEDLNTPVDPILQDLVSPHVKSFDFFLGTGMKLMVADLDPLQFEWANSNYKIWVENVSISKPSPPNGTKDQKLYPAECRQSVSTYASEFFVDLKFQKGDSQPELISRKMGTIPIMVKSEKCNLKGLTKKELIEKHEEPQEMGGYFVVNGNEKMIRLLIATRRNEVLSIHRPSFNRIGAVYSPFATQIRCVRPDQTSQTVTLHYLVDGNCNLRLIIGKAEFFIPVVVVLKSLIDTTDREIYERIMVGNWPASFASFLSDASELLLRESSELKIYSRFQCLSYLGKRFRVRLKSDYWSFGKTDFEFGQFLLDKFLLVHLNSNVAKFDLLIFMLQKLYSTVHGESEVDNLDTPMNQEILLPGQLYLSIFKEKLQDWLYGIRRSMDKLYRPDQSIDANAIRKAISQDSVTIGEKMKYFLATGNILSDSGLDLMQTSGFVVIAEKLNHLRYLSHFRCVHRGAFFATMKTTTPRKLLPESWGFLCPVHTPDGAPCGLLNHLTSACTVLTEPEKSGDIVSGLVSIGMTPLTAPVHPNQENNSTESTTTTTTVTTETNTENKNDWIWVLLDGRIIGKIFVSQAQQIADTLRYFKITKSKGIPQTLEIALVLPRKGSRFPGLFLFSGLSRMLRPVLHLATNQIEFIGSYEQVYLSVAVVDDDIRVGETTHKELDPVNMLSVVATMTPFSDFNQSPRNMYQCQMGKQSMATPMHSYPYRSDNKMYRLLNPQKPLVRTIAQSKYQMNDYPTGTNAVVAVISYTGYDMEDAMIINKSSYERGFGHGCVYKTEDIELDDGTYKKSKQQKPKTYFDNSQKKYATIDEDGLPRIGAIVKTGDVYYVTFDSVSQEWSSHIYKSQETATIEEIRLISNDNPYPTHALIKLRFNRNPVIGDKFSSRHGQKGVMSRLWPNVDMPFSESGMSPDVIINPHAFPSRMTIGMLVESLAGKSGSCHGFEQDATPFRFNEKQTAISYFGDQLTKAGYNYYGNEPMYSGTMGIEFKADIYIGVVYYQRLRHMVKDKYQVRATGKNSQLTRQPIKGRKVGGGIRFGEMERDSLLSHGISFMLHDRLMNCSDYSTCYVCSACGSILSPMTKASVLVDRQKLSNSQVICRSCQTNDYIETISIPYVFRYLTTELAAMNLAVRLDLKSFVS